MNFPETLPFGGTTLYRADFDYTPKYQAHQMHDETTWYTLLGAAVQLGMDSGEYDAEEAYENSAMCGNKLRLNDFDGYITFGNDWDDEECTYPLYLVKSLFLTSNDLVLIEVWDETLHQRQAYRF